MSIVSLLLVKAPFTRSRLQCNEVKPLGSHQRGVLTGVAFDSVHGLERRDSLV